jgi:hypothetical protein
MDTMDTTTCLVKKGYNSMILDLSSIRNLAIPDYPLFTVSDLGQMRPCAS